MLFADKIDLRYGWQHQARRLAVTHTALGTGVIQAVQRVTRPWPSKSDAYRTSNDSDCDQRTETATGELEHDFGAEPRLLVDVIDCAEIAEEAVETPADPPSALSTLNGEVGCETNWTNEELVRRENEIRSLQSSLELTLRENEHVCAQLAKRSRELAQAHSELEQVKSLLAATKAERDKLSLAINQSAEDTDVASERARLETEDDRARSTEQRELETTAFLSQLDAMFSRALAAERQLTDTQERLRIRVEEVGRAAEDNSKLRERIADGDVSLNVARSQLDEAKAALLLLEAKYRTTDAAFNDLTERHAKEVGTLTTRLRSVSSRAIAAETQILATRSSLAEKFELLQRSMTVKVGQISQLKLARLTLLESTELLLQKVNRCDQAPAEPSSAVESPADAVPTYSDATNQILAPQPTAAQLASTVIF